MQPRGQKLRAILGAELEDLIQDLRDAERIYGERFRAGDVSGYVLKENTAVLELEIAGVAAVRAAVAQSTTPPDTGPRELCAWFDTLCRDIIEKNGFPPGILAFLTRKCGKVVRYVYEAYAPLGLLLAIGSIAWLSAQETTPPEEELSPAVIEQEMRGDRSWLLMEQGRIALEHGEPGAALDLFLEARDTADREVYPEADLAIGDIWMAEGELGQAERSYLRALDGLRIAPNLLIYKEVDYGQLTVTLRERLADLYALRENYGKVQEQYEAIVKMDRDFSTSSLAERVTANYLEAGLNRVLTLYRLTSGFAVRAHQELGWLFYRNGLYEKATSHSVFAVTNILSTAIAELRRADPAYTFVSVETTLQDGYRRPNIRAYLEEAGIWKAMYYLAATTYARNSPARAREIWGILQRSRDAGTYQGLAIRQLATPWIEPPLRDAARR